jgi:bifunctional phosphoglucose/phosphomannose isomerase
MTDPFGPGRIAKVDRSRIYKGYLEWPELAQKGFGAAVDVPARHYKRVLVLGMGGSASAGDIISGWLHGRGGTEVTVFKGTLPAVDMSDSLAVVCSASGDTKETIAMMKTALENKATAVSISSSGALGDISARLGIPHVQMPAITAPRYMLPFMLFACISVLNRAVALSCEDEAQDAIAAMKKLAGPLGSGVPPARNESKRIASLLLKKTPRVYGTRLTRGVGVRFTNAVNENAKRSAFYKEIPEALHNDIESWEEPDLSFIPIFLSHPMDDPEEGIKTAAMVKALKSKGAAPLVVTGGGGTRLAGLMEMVYKLDMSSYYLAIALGRDPLPTKLLSAIKRGS